jgi:hypothetical protein
MGSYFYADPKRRPRDPSEQMILNNYITMRQVGRLKDQEMTKELVFEIHRRITEKTLDNDSEAGRFRRSDEQVVVGSMLRVGAEIT